MVLLYGELSGSGLRLFFCQLAFLDKVKVKLACYRTTFLVRTEPQVWRDSFSLASGMPSESVWSLPHFT